MTARKTRWVSSVKTDSTHPPPGLFTKNASIIARTLASRNILPKALNRACACSTISSIGRGLSASLRAELERAKSMLSKRIHRDSTPSRKPKRKSGARQKCICVQTFLIQQPLRLHQFCIQQRRSRRPSNRVMSQQNKFVPYHRTLSQPPDLHRHPSEALYVDSRLRPVRLL